MDDMLLLDQLKDSHVQPFKLSVQPRSLSVSDDKVAIIIADSQIIVHFADKCNKMLVDYQPTACCLKGSLLAVGCADGAIHFYKLHGLELTHEKNLPISRGTITCLSISEDLKYLAVGTEQRCVQIIDLFSDYSV